MNEPGGELAVLKANQEATDALPLIPAAFTHAFYEHVNRASETMRGGFRDRLDMATVDIAIAFVDLVQSTQWTERVSREEHRAALVEFESQANALAATHWCRLMKTIGDEVMITGFAAAATCRV